MSDNKADVVVFRQYLPSKLSVQEKKLQREADRAYMKQFFPWIDNKWWHLFEAAEEKYYATFPGASGRTGAASPCNGPSGASSTKPTRRGCFYDMTQALINFVNCGPSDVKASDIARYLEGRPRRSRYMTRMMALDKPIREKWSRYQFRALVNQKYEIRFFGTKSNVHLRDFKARCGYQGRQSNWEKLDQAGFVYVPKVFPDMSKVMSDYLFKEPGSMIYMPTDVIPKNMRMLPIETMKSDK